MDFTHTIDIARPAAEVFAVLADVEQNPRWQQGMQTCRWTSEPPLAVGSTYDQHARFLGRDIISRFIVTALEPERSISIETTESTFPIQVTRSVEPTGEHSCRVTAHIRGQPGFPLSLMSPMVLRSVRADYQRLQQWLEESTAS